jgi:hypothetical protein
MLLVSAKHGRPEEQIMATTTVTRNEQDRTVTFVVNGVEITLPAHEAMALAQAIAYQAPLADPLI